MNASLTRLQSFYGGLHAPLLLHAMITREFKGAIGVLLTAGTEASELLKMIAAIDIHLPLLCQEQASIAPLYGFSHIIPLAGDPYDMIEDLALLAIISDEQRAHDMPRITLDAQGVFRIYPLTGTALHDKNAGDNADWSV